MWIQISDFPAPHAFSTRRCGQSSAPFDSLDLSLVDAPESPRRATIDDNARRFTRALGIHPACVATVRQVHGTRIVEVVDPESKGAPATDDCAVFAPDLERDLLAPPLCEADGLITRSPRIALAIRTADCVPILLFGQSPGTDAAIAALHAGWRGSLDNIAARAVRLFADRFGIAPRHIQAAIGPCIGPCCYEVSAALARDFEARFGAGVIHGVVDGSPRLDLVQVNRLSLLNAGLSEASIHTSARCTACESERFFSHRRDQGQTGRHLSIVALA
ncbi:MAG: peptidoglycan editing factor PgeF [Myxococcaceae bacterium]|nr:peptidoglycan editing factor PgeF [Myxococcaceae bacterium]